MPDPDQTSALADAILRAAASLIEDEGSEALTMRAVAARAGYSPTAIYLVYKNKDELLEKALIHAHQSLVRSLFPESADEDDVALRLRHIAVTFVRWGISNPNLYKLLYDSESRITLEPMGSTARQLWSRSAGLLGRAVDQGLITRCKDPEVLALLSWAALHGIVWLAISNRMSTPEAPRSAQEIEGAVTGLADAFVSLVLDTPCCAPPE